MKIFVTVGTTQFDDLIQKVLSQEILDVFKKLRCRKLTIQSGATKFDYNKNKQSFNLDVYQYKDSIQDDLREADLVISHAGAGSILESLALKKSLIVVINESLMNNHQYELAAKMAEENYLYYCTCKNLRETLVEKDLSKLKEKKESNSNAFASFVDKFMGFEN